MTVEFAVDTSDPTKFISQIAHSELELDQALELVDQFEPYAFCKALVNYINTPKLFGDDAKVDLFSFTLNLYKFCKKFHTLNSSVIDKDYISDDLPKYAFQELLEKLADLLDNIDQSNIPISWEELFISPDDEYEQVLKPTTRDQATQTEELPLTGIDIHDY